MIGQRVSAAGHAVTTAGHVVSPAGHSVSTGGHAVSVTRQIVGTGGCGQYVTVFGHSEGTVGQ